MLFYLMWAALAPAIFALAGRVPFGRHNWIRPLGFHVAVQHRGLGQRPVALVYAFGRRCSNGFRRFHASAAGVVLLGCVRRCCPWSPYTHLYWVILAAALSLDAYDESQARLRQAAELERTLVAAQVDALKMKLQPHFLFNTLNSISFLAVEKDGDGWCGWCSASARCCGRRCSPRGVNW